MIWRTLILLALILSAMAAAKARAADCPGNPNALGTSRVMTIDPHEFPRIGTVQYKQSLPLQDKEVVLTFDDGPMPPYTNRVLDVLAEHCVKANYFIIGRMARGYADLLKRIHTDGHVIGNHSQNHPLAFERMPLNAVQDEIEQGFASLAAALGDRRAVAPFFRIPGLLRAREVEGYLQSRGLVTWSADVVADDWKHITASEVVRRAVSRLDEKGKGILLLHDIQPATALALPELLRQLKAKGYRIVQVVPGKGPNVPVATAKTPPAELAAARATAPAVAEVHQAAAPPVRIANPLLARPIVVTPAPQPAEAEPVRVAAPVAAMAAIPASDPSPPPRDEPNEEPARKAALAPSAADSLARGDSIARDPVRPFTSGSRPARNMPTPDKFVTTEPGGWPPTVSVPVARAGGIGVSAPPPSGQSADGRFQ